MRLELRVKFQVAAFPIIWRERRVARGPRTCSRVSFRNCGPQATRFFRRNRGLSQDQNLSSSHPLSRVNVSSFKTTCTFVPQTHCIEEPVMTRLRSPAAWVPVV